MATEENHEISNLQTTTLPDYPEMILSAIKTLNEKEGSNKTSITKQIESVHKDIHPAHATLVSHHLDVMKSSNQLTLINNNYIITDPPTSPPPQRRGRGRPPKAKVTGGGGKKRGRPAKINGLKSVVDDVKESGVVKRGRGRPSKVKESDVAVGA